MSNFKLWVSSDNKHLRAALCKTAKERGYTLANILINPLNRGFYFKGKIITHQERDREYFDRHELREISLDEFFALEQRTIFNPFSGEKVEISEESYQALKDSFKD